MSAHAPQRAKAYHGLLPIVIGAEALLDFGEKIDNQLADLEEQYPVVDRPLLLTVRKAWHPKPRRPR